MNLNKFKKASREVSEISSKIMKLDSNKEIQKKIDEEIRKKIMTGEKIDKEVIEYKIRKEIYNNIKELSNKLINISRGSIWAREKLMKSLFILGEDKEFEIEARKILEKDKKNEIALWYLSKLKRKQGDLYGEKECLVRLKEYSNDGNIRVLNRLEKINELINKKEEKEELKKMVESEKNEDGEKNRPIKEIIFTEEDRKIFIENMRKKFISGEIHRKNISIYKEKAKKYPNYYESLKEILDIETMITGKIENKLTGLVAYLNVAPQEERKELYEEIENVKKEIEYEKEINKKIEEKYKNPAREQRRYSSNLIKRLEKGEVKEEEVFGIVKKLEKFEDRERSIFLITKLYDIVYGKERALGQLNKYRMILDLSKKEEEKYKEYAKKISNPDRAGKTRKLKVIYGTYDGKKEKNETKYNRKIEEETINKVQQMIKEGKTIFEICEEMKNLSLKRVSIIRGKYIKADEELLKKQKYLEKYAYSLLMDGENIDEIYSMFEGDVPKSKIRLMEKEIKAQDLVQNQKGENRNE